MIIGYLDCVEPAMVGGWACDRLSPASPVRVRIMLGQKMLGEVMADLFRDDLSRAGIGSGAHGFRLHLGVPLSSEEMPLLTAEVVSGDGTARLARWDGSRPAARTGQGAEKLEKVLVTVGNIEKLLDQPPREFEEVLFDPINNCNIHAPIATFPALRSRLTKRFSPASSPATSSARAGFSSAAAWSPPWTRAWPI